MKLLALLPLAGGALILAGFVREWWQDFPGWWRAAWRWAFRFRPYFWCWNVRCWAVWHFWKPPHGSSRTVATTSLGPLGIYWERADETRGER